MIENKIKPTCIILALNKLIDNLEICQGNNYQLELITDPLHLQIGTYTLSKEMDENENLLHNSAFYRLLTNLELTDSFNLIYNLINGLNTNLKRKNIYKIDFIGIYKNEKPNKKFSKTAAAKKINQNKTSA